MDRKLELSPAAKWAGLVLLHRTGSVTPSLSHHVAHLWVRRVLVCVVPPEAVAIRQVDHRKALWDGGMRNGNEQVRRRRQHTRGAPFHPQAYRLTTSPLRGHVKGTAISPSSTTHLQAHCSNTIWGSFHKPPTPLAASRCRHHSVHGVGRQSHQSPAKENHHTNLFYSMPKCVYYNIACKIH